MSSWRPFPNPIPRGEWPGPDHRWKPAPHTQGTELRCVSEAATAAMEFMAARAGYPAVRLDALALHGKIADPALGGAQVGTAMSETEDNGVRELSGPRTWRAKWWLCEEKVNARPRASFALAYSAVLKDYPLVIALGWRAGFQPDPHGWLKPEAGGQSFGHAILGYAPATRTINGATEWGIWCMQSQGSFSPKTGSRVVLSEKDLAGASFYACQSVAYSE